MAYLPLDQAIEHGTAPHWMNSEAYSLLQNKYLLDGETPFGMYYRLAKTAASHYFSEDSAERVQLQDAFLAALWNGYLSPSTPVATNFGAPQEAKRGMPVSCFGLRPDNSIHGIFATAQEGAVLTKHGGGLGIDISDLKGLSPVTHWAKIYDVMAEMVSQGSIRRGAVALYIDIEHDDIEAFLEAHDTTRGDQRSKLNCNIAVKVSDAFMTKLSKGDSKALQIFAKVLELRMKTGSPYLQFTDTINNNRPIDYKALDLKVHASQLCSEITLYSDCLHTYSCVLSSLNAATFDEWYSLAYYVGEYKLTVPMLGIWFLDAVCQEFLDKAKHIPGFENSVRATEKGRPLGLGVLGLHSLYQKHMMPFDSDEAEVLNMHLHSFIQAEAIEASLVLGELKGIPEWCQASGQRNTHLLAIAPTLANSVLCCAGSPGIEPVSSNLYIHEGPNGSALRKNQHLAKLLAEIPNEAEVWTSIAKHDGSVQHLRGTILTDAQADVFKTAREIDQMAIIRQASHRQSCLDQGQSINLFLPHDAPNKLIWQLHIEAWKQGLYTLYYVRSTSPLNVKQPTTLQQAKPIEAMQWDVYGRDTCIYCKQAIRLLAEAGVNATFIYKPEGEVPVIYADEELIGGHDDLVRYLAPTGAVLKEEISCSGCDG